MSDVERIARELPDDVREWLAGWPECSLRGDWWFTAKDVNAKPKWMWCFLSNGCLRRTVYYGRRVYQWTDLGRAAALAASQPQGGETRATASVPSRIPTRSPR
jgi:hypothetical protein